MVAQPDLPFWVRRDVGPVVVEQVRLNLALTGPRKIGILAVPGIRIVTIRMGRASEVSSLSGVERKKGIQHLRMGLWIRPIFCDLGPFGSEACLIDIAVLSDERMQLIGVRQNDAEADRRAVVVKIQGIVRELQLLQQITYCLGKIIESVSVSGRRWCIA